MRNLVLAWHTATDELEEEAAELNVLVKERLASVVTTPLARGPNASGGFPIINPGIPFGPNQIADVLLPDTPM